MFNQETILDKEKTVKTVEYRNCTNLFLSSAPISAFLISTSQRRLDLCTRRTLFLHVLYMQTYYNDALLMQIAKKKQKDIKRKLKKERKKIVDKRLWHRPHVLLAPIKFQPLL